MHTNCRSQAEDSAGAGVYRSADILGVSIHDLDSAQTIKWIGHAIAAGVYLCRLETAGFAATRRLALVK